MNFFAWCALAALIQFTVASPADRSISTVSRTSSTSSASPTSTTSDDTTSATSSASSTSSKSDYTTSTPTSATSTITSDSIASTLAQSTSSASTDTASAHVSNHATSSLPLRLGLGIGIPVALLFLAAIFLFWLRHRTNSRREHHQRLSVSLERNSFNDGFIQGPSDYHKVATEEQDEAFHRSQVVARAKSPGQDFTAIPIRYAGYRVTHLPEALLLPGDLTVRESWAERGEMSERSSWSRLSTYSPRPSSTTG